MVNALGQHHIGNLEMEMTLSARTTLDRASAAGAPSAQSVDTGATSVDLLRRLAELVDGFVRLSRFGAALPENIEIRTDRASLNPPMQRRCIGQQAIFSSNNRLSVLPGTSQKAGT